MSGQFYRGRDGIVLAVGLSCVFFAASCGGPKIPQIQGKLPVFPVKGSIQMNGKPLANATLMFVPTKPFPEGSSQLLPRARSKDDGTFEVSTYADNDGAPAGTYRVAVTWRGAGTGEDDERHTDDDPNLIPASYHNPRSTRLRAKVEEGENNLQPFDLKVGEQQASN